MGQTGVHLILIHGTVEQDGHRDTYIHVVNRTDWDMSHSPMVQWDGMDVRICIIVNTSDLHTYLLISPTPQAWFRYREELDLYLRELACPLYFSGC